MICRNVVSFVNQSSVAPARVVCGDFLGLFSLGVYKSEESGQTHTNDFILLFSVCCSLFLSRLVAAPHQVMIEADRTETN